jgi:hypothetical protein
MMAVPDRALELIFRILVLGHDVHTVGEAEVSETNLTGGIDNTSVGLTSL